MNIRKAIRQDVGSVVKFNLAMAWETEEYKLDEKVLTSGVNAVLDDPNRGFYLVAEVDNKVVGSLMVTTEWSDWRNGVFWWVQSVYVEPEYRRRGVFKAMYEQVRQQAKNTTGVCGCRLYVERDNTSAQATYTKLGFVETKYRMFEEPF
jgi:ribosomal protein S18 acetylase RimI-like enzyme